ncbi:MAG: 50S ribosomal protein L28 [Rickettsiales bacterium]
MSKVCQISGVGVASGNNVSHSNRKTKKKFHPNLQMVTLRSEVLGQDFRMRIAVKTLRSIDAKGGLDGYLLGSSSRKITEEAVRIKNKIKKKSEQVKEQA